MELNPFTIELDSHDHQLEARFIGDLTLDAEEAMTRAFDGIDLTGKPALTIDFARVPYVNSAGIAALLGALIRLRDRTAGIRFTGLSRHLEKIFRMTGFPSLVTM
jgi:anti-anti-sigma factor